MTAVTNEYDILSNVKTTLETITVANGYTNTVDAVEFHYRTWATAGRAGDTIIGILPNRTEVQPITHNEYRCTLRYQLVCHVQPSTDALRWSGLESIIDDCINALNQDPTRDGNAIDTVVTGWSTDMGDPDTHDHRGGSGTAVIDVVSRYHRLAMTTLGGGGLPS